MTNEKIYIIWGNYEGTLIEQFDAATEYEAAEARITEIQAKVAREKATGDPYGTEIDKIIRGKELEAIPITVTTVYALGEKTTNTTAEGNL
jgi:hypothetical protein